MNNKHACLALRYHLDAEHIFSSMFYQYENSRSDRIREDIENCMSKASSINTKDIDGYTLKLQAIRMFGARKFAKADSECTILVLVYRDEICEVGQEITEIDMSKHLKYDYTEMKSIVSKFRMTRDWTPKDCRWSYAHEFIPLMMNQIARDFENIKKHLKIETLVNEDTNESKIKVKVDLRQADDTFKMYTDYRFENIPNIIKELVTVVDEENVTSNINQHICEISLGQNDLYCDAGIVLLNESNKNYIMIVMLTIYGSCERLLYVESEIRGIFKLVSGYDYTSRYDRNRTDILMNTKKCIAIYKEAQKILLG